jgi:RNA polymerase sigma-70 factor (ECF subfamily)
LDFEELVNEHKDAVYRQMVRVCHNEQDAEDVLVEALLRAYRGLDQLRDSGHFRAWLAMIGRRVCWRLKARERLRPLLELSDAEPDPQPLPDEQAISRQMRDLLEQAIQSMPVEFQAIYRLRDIQGLTGEEAAERLGITLANAKTRLHRARQMVREFLDHAVHSAVVG